MLRWPETEILNWVQSTKNAASDKAQADREASGNVQHHKKPAAKESKGTIRDQFAMAAMQGLLAIYDREISEGGPGFDVCPRAYRIADSMLRARES